MSDMELGRISAAATPMRARPRISISTELASAQMAELRANPAVPQINARLAPKRSDRLPASSRSVANGRV